jgi:ribosomal protein S18 acetylase RimI-like enzyme
MTIRPAIETDHDRLRDLWGAFDDELGTPHFLRTAWENTWGDARRHADDGLGFVAEEDGAILGFIFAAVPPKTTAFAHITDLYVVPDARHRGVGRELTARIVDSLADRGIDHVGLDVRIDNVGAGAFYDRLGFVPLERFVTASVSDVRERLGATAAKRPSFGSTHAQTDDETSVDRTIKQFLPRLGGSARTETSRSPHGWITIYDELCDRDRTAQRRFGAELSARLGVPVVALRLEEEAVVRFYLFERGRMIDEYLSVPTYFGEVSKADELSLAANPTLVARLTGADPALVRAVARTAPSTSELPPGPQLFQEIASLMGLESGIER